MAQIVKLRRSSVTGNKPTTAQLELGELAINTFDGKLYFEKSGSDGESIEDVKKMLQMIINDIDKHGVKDFG